MSDPVALANPNPPLKWAGGKRWLLPHLRELWNGREHLRLVEPFVGGMSVALGLNPEKALLNDINPHLINFYKRLKAGLVPSAYISMQNDEGMYYAVRNTFNSLIKQGESETAQAASYFYYLNRTGYNGLCRFNLSGGFNVPFGKYKTINYTLDFREYQTAVARWEFTCGDFYNIYLGANDLIYADPPYDGTFTGYSRGAFDWNDQIRLANWLALHHGPVIASNSATDRIIDLYLDRGFSIRFLDAPRRISCNGDRTPVREMLATKNIDL